MRDNVLDLASDDATGAARGMVAQVATLARAFTHDAEAMAADQLRAQLAALAAMDGDAATLAARDLVTVLLNAEVGRRDGAGLQAAAG